MDQPLRFRYGTAQIHAERIFVGSALSLNCALLLSSLSCVVLHQTFLHLLLLPPVFLLAWFSADLGGAVFHMFADHNCLRHIPVFSAYNSIYRRHHGDPEECLRNPYLTNASWVAGVVLAPLTCYSYLLRTSWPLLAFFLATFVTSLLITEQAHRFAHMAYADVPFYGKFLQKCGLFLSSTDHARHHQGDHGTNFSVLAGWTDRVIALPHPFAPKDKRMAGNMLAGLSMVVSLAPSLFFM
eukprot:TRINITY_DN3144_c0_g1_i7.p1 TRINITY_DN3144_c0_g1~~TRINITY_DN3144_c0_g1_i7.p1  ORF type:complete len:240 (+),score=44.14 TRINITY_DN3144_c0_g1_i7:105-824(+)